MGGESQDVVTTRKVNLGDGQPYAVIDTGFFSPFDAVFWMVYPHPYIQDGSHRAVLSTPSNIFSLSFDYYLILL